jgi:hypothetical protein
MSNVSILLKYTSIINKFAFVGENEVLSYSRLVNKKICTSTNLLQSFFIGYYVDKIIDKLIYFK